MCRQLHATHVDTAAFECVKDRYARELAENPFFTSVEKDRLLRFIQDAPDTDTAIHGMPLIILVGKAPTRKTPLRFTPSRGNKDNL